MRLSHYAKLFIAAFIVLSISIGVYVALLRYDLSVASGLLSEASVYPIYLGYNCSSSIGTFQFAVLYNVNLTLVIDRPGHILVKNMYYNVTTTYYVPKTRINKELLNRLYLDKDMFEKVFLIDKPMMYYIGEKPLLELLHTTNTIPIQVGNETVQYPFIIYNGYAMILRGTDTVSLKKLSGTSLSVVIVRIAPLINGEPPRNITYYNRTIYYLKHNGLLYKITYDTGISQQTLTLQLTNYTGLNAEKFLLITNMYERLSEIDYPKFILFNAAMFFAVLIIWSILIGGLENKKPGRKWGFTGFVSLLLSLVVIFIGMYYGFPYSSAIYFFLTAIGIITICLAIRDLIGDTAYFLSALTVPALLVISFINALLPVWFHGSLYKLGIESGVLNPVYTNVTASMLLGLGLPNIVILKEVAYYYLGSIMYAQLPFIIMVIGMIGAGIASVKKNPLVGLIMIISCIPYLLIVPLNPRIPLVKYVLSLGRADYVSLASSSMTLLYGTPLITLGLMATIIPVLFFLIILFALYLRLEER